MTSLRISLFAVVLLGTGATQAGDWARFRGPQGSGVATDNIPMQWSPAANLAWKTELPGPGASSPIVVDGRAFVTCYSGYGLSQENPGNIEDLVRHLVCVDLETGKVLWQQDVKAELPEDPYSGIGVTAHGYASHTPVCDGKHVYAFFGKSGVHAFDMDGKKLWHADVGKESDPAKWGSSSSPVVYEDTVIVTASAESQAIIGLDAATGKELWRQEARGLDGMWGTPTLVEIDDNRTDLVMCVAKELWGLDPNSGRMRWYADATGAEQAYTGVVLDGARVYAFTGRGGGSIAVDAGGSGNVSESNTVWTGNETSSFASPVRHKSKLYVVSRGIVTSVDASTGERLQQVRLAGARQTGGRFGSPDYPSPIIVGDRMFYLNGSGQMFVFELEPELKQVAVNQVTQDEETFWGTPAVSNGRLLMRSSKHLYCVTDKGQTVAPGDTVVANAEPAAPAPGRGGPGRGGSGGGPGGGTGRFDPMSFFNGLDTNSDGKVTAEELEGNRMADRFMQLDKDDDKAITQDEYRSGMSTLFGGGRGGAGGRGGTGGGGAAGGRGGAGGGYRGRGEDTRPDRPQRPEMVGQ